MISTPRILFVCTGNIFRSLTAEYALRHALRRLPDERAHQIVVESAGTEDYPHVVAPMVGEYLLSKGLDVRAHRRRTLTAQMLAPPTRVIAMSTEHCAALREQFDYRDAPLFSVACGLPEAPLPDVDEAVADHYNDPEGTRAHVHATIDRIIAWTPGLVQRLLADR